MLFTQRHFQPRATAPTPRPTLAKNRAETSKSAQARRRVGVHILASAGWLAPIERRQGQRWLAEVTCSRQCDARRARIATTRTTQDRCGS